jgi:hypothetical protein
MNKFGKLKGKILTRLTESYSNKNMKDVKNVLEIIKENKDFKEMYLFYDEMENKYFDNKETAKLYVEEISTMLKNKNKNISTFCSVLNECLHISGDITESEIYQCLDILSENDTLLNVDKKVTAKHKLIEHLTSEKEVKLIEESTIIPNENLLYAVLTNNFNLSFNSSLNEEQKKELKDIVSLSDEELTTKTIELKESILNHVSKLITESSDDVFKSKLTQVKDEVNQMSTSKYNYYRLKELKGGLN